MRRLLCSVLALAVCSFVTFTTPASAAAAAAPVPYLCPDGGGGDCEYGGDEFCPSDPPNNDNHWCGAAGYECSDGSWDIDCVWAEEDVECPDVCAVE